MKRYRKKLLKGLMLFLFCLTVLCTVCPKEAAASQGVGQRTNVTGYQSSPIGVSVRLDSVQRNHAQTRMNEVNTTQEKETSKDSSGFWKIMIPLLIFIVGGILILLLSSVL